jgi:hypothetical protein
LEKEGLNTINISKLKYYNEEKLSIIFEINEFEKESKKLNYKYNGLFNKINKDIQTIYKIINI